MAACPICYFISPDAEHVEANWRLAAEMASADTEEARKYRSSGLRMEEEEVPYADS